MHGWGKAPQMYAMKLSRNLHVRDWLLRPRVTLLLLKSPKPDPESNYVCPQRVEYSILDMETAPEFLP